MTKVGEGSSAELPARANGWSRWQPFVIAVAAIVVAGVLLHALTGASSLYALLLAPFVILRNVLWRVGLNRLVVIALLALVPIVLRRRGRLALRRWWHRVVARVLTARDAFLRGWNAAPVWVRTFLGSLALIGVLAVAVLSGVVLWVIAFLPFVAKTAVGLFVIKYLAHFAAARGVTGLAPLLWRFIPQRLRLWVERRYRHLWWWTMRRIVRNRRRMVHRVWRRGAKGAPLPTAKTLPL
jgi:hypothetical protein